MKIEIFRKDAFINTFYGEKYKVNDYDYKSGLYLLIKNKEIVYIGVSDYLGKRINQHRKDKDFDVIVILKDETFFYDKKDLEAILINLFVPKHNKQIPNYNSFFGIQNKITSKIDENIIVDLIKITESPEGKLTKFLKQNRELFKQLSEI